MPRMVYIGLRLPPMGALAYIPGVIHEISWALRRFISWIRLAVNAVMEIETS